MVTVQLGSLVKWRAAKERPIVPAPMIAILLGWIDMVVTRVSNKLEDNTLTKRPRE